MTGSVEVCVSRHNISRKKGIVGLAHWRPTKGLPFAGMKSVGIMHDSGNSCGKKTFLGSEKGLTLVEVLFAAIILGIALVSFSYMFGTAGADIVKLGTQRVCLEVARQEMEDLLNLPYDHPELAATDEVEFNHYRRFRRPPANVKISAVDGDLFVRWAVTYFNDPHGTSQRDYKRILLELYDDLFDEATWSLGSNPSSEIKDLERVVTLTTFIAP